MIECFLAPHFDAVAALAVGVMLGMALLARWITNQPFFYGRPFFIVTILGVGWWLLAQTFRISSPEEGCAVFWSVMAWPAIALIPVGWMFFVLDYAFSRAERYGPRRLALLILPPLLITMAAATDPLHGMFYGTGMRPIPASGETGPIENRRPLFLLATGWLYALLLVSVAVLLYAAFRGAPAFRGHFLLLFFVTIAPVAAGVAHVEFGVTALQLDPTPFVFALVLVLLSWLIFSSRMFDIAAGARSVLFEKMPNPVLILDEAEVVVGANPAALALPGVGAATGAEAGRGRIGAPITEWPPIAAALAEARVQGHAELQIRGRFYQLQQIPMDKPLQVAGGGLVLLLVEVTEARQRTRRLEESLRENEQRLAENMALRERLEQLVNRDPLTGLYNRRAMTSFFDAFCSGEDGATAVTIAVIDLDHFKAFNDRHGHAEGDRLLRSFAQILGRTVEASRPVFRIGGEEFLVMFPDIGAETAAAVLDRARAKLTPARLGLADAAAPVTFSAGIACWPQDGADFEAVFAVADARLYLGKARGRNQIVRHQAAPDG